jgi:group I intron endonuclease
MTGIYQIRNTLNNDIYIGSTSKSFNRRRIQHFSELRKGKHHSVHLQRAVNKYGINNFVFEVIKECNKEKCIEFEQYYLDLLSPRYNINIKATSRLGIKVRDLDKHRLARNSCNWKITDDGRKRISETHKGIPKTKEHVEKVAAAQRKPVIQLTKDGEFIKRYPSAKIAASLNGWNTYCRIYDVCNGRRKTAYNYKWIYADK